MLSGYNTPSQHTRTTAVYSGLIFDHVPQFVFLQLRGKTFWETASAAVGPILHEFRFETKSCLLN